MAINPRPSNIDRSLLQAPNDTFSALEDNLLDQELEVLTEESQTCLLYTSPSPRDGLLSRMPSSA